MGMTLTEMRTALRTELKDPATLWSDTELDRAVVKAVDDVSRFFPLEKLYEVTIKPSVAAEAWTAAAAAGTYVQLANKPIQYNSETVKDSAAVTCTRDTDYTLDYINGKITHIAGGKISNGEVCSISYTKSRIVIPIGTLNAMRIFRVEYPYGNVPQQFASYDIFEDKLWLTGVESDTQAKMAEGKHIVIYYLTVHAAPVAAAAGSFPPHLDEPVVKGAASYSCFIKALEYEHQTATDLASARTELAAISHTAIGAAFTAAITQLAAAATALAKVDTYLVGAAGGVAAKQYLDVGDALFATLETYLTGATAPSVKKYLEDGDDLINAVNKGERVAENYAIYAQRSAELAASFEREIASYSDYAGRCITLAQGFINESEQRNTSGRWYLQEVDSRLAEIDRYLGEADRYMTAAIQSIALAERWRTEGTQRRDEFLLILRDRAELRGRAVSTAAVRQLKNA